MYQMYVYGKVLQCVWLHCHSPQHHDGDDAETGRQEEREARVPGNGSCIDTAEYRQSNITAQALHKGYTGKQCS